LQYGIGSLWRTLQLIDSLTQPCSYIASSKAAVEYQKLSGCTTTTAVPVEQDGGQECGAHWDEACFQDELMTGSSTGSTLPLLSRVTVASLEDVGYTVNYDNADPYTSANLDPSCRCQNVGKASDQIMISLSNFTGVGGLIPNQFERGSGVRNLSVRQILSAEGRMAAIVYGNKLLGLAQERRAAMVGTDLGDQIFVGDRYVRIFYLEAGLVHSVDVWADDDAKRAV
jgi:hypothetical protein